MCSALLYSAIPHHPVSNILRHFCSENYPLLSEIHTEASSLIA